MLYGYPLAATADNWLHDCLVEALQAIHAAAKAGGALPAGVDLIPVSFRHHFSSRHALPAKLEAYAKAFRRLSAVNRSRVERALAEQNAVETLLAGTSTCEQTDNLPFPIRKPTKDLFKYAFRLLGSFQLRDQHFAVISASGAEVCPFCGFENFEGEGGARTPLDHYLDIERYSFAGVNLRNLVPMGDLCNSRYKAGKDVLHTTAGQRRIVFDPYLHTGTQFDMSASVPFARAGNRHGWVINFAPAGVAADAWDDIFEIRTRYSEHMLDRRYEGWLAVFGQYCVDCLGRHPIDDGQLVRMLSNYIFSSKLSGANEFGFLKCAIFEMLKLHLINGDAETFRHLYNAFAAQANLPLR